MSSSTVVKMFDETKSWTVPSAALSQWKFALVSLEMSDTDQLYLPPALDDASVVEDLIEFTLRDSVEPQYPMLETIKEPRDLTQLPYMMKPWVLEFFESKTVDRVFDLLEASLQVEFGVLTNAAQNILALLYLCTSIKEKMILTGVDPALVQDTIPVGLMTEWMHKQRAVFQKHERWILKNREQ